MKYSKTSRTHPVVVSGCCSVLDLLWIGACLCDPALVHYCYVIVMTVVVAVSFLLAAEALELERANT